MLENAIGLAHERLCETLGKEGWRVRRSGRGVRARWRWVSVTLKYHPEIFAEQPWRGRLRDGFPRVTIAEQWWQSPTGGLDNLVARAREVRAFSEGSLGLMRNPSKCWLGHRVWQAVRPTEIKS